MPIRAKVSINPGHPLQAEFDTVLITQRKSKRTGFFMAYNDSLFELVLNRNLASGDLKVLFYMVANMGYDNVCELTVSEIAVGLDLTRRIATRAIQRLLKLQIIHPARTMGRATFYLISPYIFIKTKPSEQKKMIAKWDALFEGVAPVLEVVGGRRIKGEPVEERSRSRRRSKGATA